MEEERPVQLSDTLVIHARVGESNVTWCDRDILTNPSLEIASVFKNITCKSCKNEILRNI
jgi:hypothetical protein